MVKQPKKRKFLHFYSKSLLIGILAICTITLILSLIIGTLFDQYEKAKFFSSYDKTLSDLQRGLQSKTKNFYTELTPLFSSPENHNTLINLMEQQSIQEISPLLRINTATILSELSSRNRYCVGMLLYSEESHLLYRYDVGSQSVTVTPRYTPFFIDQQYTTNIVASSELRALDPSLPQSLYGLSATLTSYPMKQEGPEGYIVFLYNLSELSEPLEERAFPEQAVFSLFNSRGNTIYSSSGDYTNTNPIVKFAPTVQTNNVLTTSPEPVQSDKQDIYLGSIFNGRYDFFATYEVPSFLLGKSQSKTLVYILAASICLISISIYGTSFYHTHRKVRNIEVGMEHIGEHNLEYRIPEPKGEDEYSQIIKGFNRMCDELEENIEKNYIYQLQQKQAELYAMQVSVDPHFLYNTLEMIRMQSLTGNTQDASQMILLLSKIYRNQVNRNLYVTLREEIEHCENILCLYQYRFENVEYEISIGNELLSYALPKNTLQPLIENYFVHGFNATKTDNFIQIRGELTEDQGETMVRLVVEDNGNSVSKERLEELRHRLQLSVFETQKDHGLALPNIHTRLRIVFGDNSGVRLSTVSPTSGFRAELFFPPKQASELQREEEAVYSKSS